MESKVEFHPVIRKKTILAPFLYLFTMDLARIPFETFDQYNSKEPGFAIPMLNGYIIAFQMDTQGTMSHELLKGIHKAAMSHLNDQSEYKAAYGSFLISLPQLKMAKVPTYSATTPGLKQFIHDWIDDAKTHTLVFDNNLVDEKRVGYIVTSEKNTTVLKSIIHGKVTLTLFNEKQHLSMLTDAMKQGFTCEINHMETVEESLIKVTTSNHLDKIFIAYNTEIVQASTDDERIITICKFVQRIEQLHPFMDGNVRTCYILLNKLLNDNKLPLSLLINPNRLDCCAVDEIVTMVKEGQVIYTTLLIHTNPKTFSFHTQHEFISALRSVSCPGVNLKNDTIYEQFINSVLNCNISIPKVLLPKSHGELLLEVQKLNPPVKLMNVLKERKYGLALRQACANNSFSIAQCILKFKEDLKLNVNEQSSNGYTALDWADASEKNLENHELLRSIMIEHGAKNNKVTKKQSHRLCLSAQ